MSDFIMGEGAVKYLPLVHEQFTRLRLRAANLELGAAWEGFHPLMSQVEACKAYPVSLLDELFSSDKLVQTEEKDLKIKATVYENHPNIDGFKKRGYSICKTVANDFPFYQSEMEQALKLIKNHGGWINRLFEELIFEICPIVDSDNKIRIYGGFSCFPAIGTIFVSLMPKPNEVVELAISLVHELGHQVLNLLQNGQNPIATESFDTQIYSGVRKQDRPALLSLHAAVALAYMHQFCLSLENAGELPTSDLNYVKNQRQQHFENLGKGIQALETVSLNPLGKRILIDLKGIL